MLYADSIITTCCSNHDDIQKGIGKGIIDFADGLLTQIFSGKYKNIIIPEMMLETAQKLWQGVRAEWGKTENTTYTSDSAKWLNRVHNNIYAFSAAKSYTQLVELRNAVFDEKGKTKSYTQFRETAKTILDKYNELYLETEYEAAVRSTIMARQWLDIERDKDIYPFLEYVTAGDERVRLSHEELEGKVFPVDSPFWQKYYPPNGWLCRCTVKKLKEGKVSDLEATLKMADASTPDYWKKNVGTAEIFDPKETAYFDGFPKRQLEAVKDYGMKPVNRSAYSNLPELTKDTISIAEVENIERKVVKDYDGLILVERQFYTNKYISNYETTVKEPDEVWTNLDQKCYIKYYQNYALVVLADLKSSSTGITPIPYGIIESYRKGILNFRK